MNDFQTIEQLLNEVQTISESYERVAEATGENFNIFSILKIETDEVTTHSRFIAELLSPNGVHEQKDEFLKLFTEMFSALEFNTLNAKVKPEHTIDDGRIDIFLEDDSQNVIIIENKIYAGKQKDQLLRYKKAYPKSKLFYLTLFEDEENSKEVDYIPISYENDIIEWLEKCKEKSVDIPILRESINQYINLIKKLTNQNLNRKMSQDVTYRILKDQNSFKAYKTLVQSKNEVFKTVMNEKVIPMLKEIEKKYALTLVMNKSFSNTDKLSFRFENEKLIKNNLAIFFSFEKAYFKDFVYGFRFYNKEKIDDYSYDKTQKAFAEVFGKYKSSPPNSLCYKVFSGYKDWSNLNTLEKIQYEFEDFKDQFKNKIDEMLKMV